MLTIFHEIGKKYCWENNFSRPTTITVTKKIILFSFCVENTKKDKKREIMPATTAAKTMKIIIHWE